MLIYGWGYFNRRDHGVVRTSCPGCGSRGHFKSYTSSKFFTLYFVPVIPLGTEKIVSECPSCKRALTMPLRKWTRLKNSEIPALLSAYEATPNDEQAAARLIDALTGLHGRSTLLRVGPQIRSAFSRNPRILTQLAGAYSHLCLDKEADATYLEAVAQSSDEQTAAAANAHLEAQKLPKPKPPHRLLQSLPVMIVPAALVLLLGAYLQKAVNSRPENAFLINGLNHAYDVVVNGQPVSLRAHQRIPSALLRFGENTITPAASHEFIAATSFEIDVPWYRRAFDKSLVVVNPDQAALLAWERTGYAYPKPPDRADLYRHQFHGGRAVHQFEEIDFPFIAFPDTVSTPADGTIVYRTRVSDFNSYEPEKIVRILSEEKNTALVVAYLSAQLKNPASDTATIRLGAHFLPREKFIAIAGPHLAVRPVQIEWHRAYQTIVEDTPEGASLIDRYRAYAAQNPDDSTLLYLHGRVVDDIDQSLSLFERALKSDQPSPYAAYALSYHYALEGDFARALDYAQRAVALSPSNDAFRHARNVALLGNKDFAALLREAGDPFTGKNPTYDIIYEHVYRLGKTDDASKAARDIARFLDKISKTQPMDASARRQGEAYLNTALDCARQDAAALTKNLSVLEGSGWEFQRTVLAGNLTAAARLVDKTPEAAGLPGRLVLYIRLSQAAETEAAARQLAAITDELGKGLKDQKQWAAWLRGDAAPDPRIAAHSCYDPDLHYLYLAALAQKHPSHAAEYIARAKAIRTRDSFYSLAIGHL